MKYLFIAFLLLSSCQSKYSMTNDEIIAEVKKCESAGMKASIGHNGLNHYWVTVLCEPKEK